MEPKGCLFALQGFGLRVSVGFGGPGCYFPGLRTERTESSLGTSSKGQDEGDAAEFINFLPSECLFCGPHNKEYILGLILKHKTLHTLNGLNAPNTLNTLDHGTPPNQPSLRSDGSGIAGIWSSRT